MIIGNLFSEKIFFDAPDSVTDLFLVEVIDVDIDEFLILFDSYVSRSSSFNYRKKRLLLPSWPDAPPIFVYSVRLPKNFFSLVYLAIVKKACKSLFKYTFPLYSTPNVCFLAVNCGLTYPLSILRPLISLRLFERCSRSLGVYPPYISDDLSSKSLN